VRVLIVADVRLHREGISAALGQRPGIEVVATADAVEGLAAARNCRPDVIVIDMTTPESVRSLRAISATLPGAKLLALAVLEAEQEVLACAEAEVVGYVSHEASLEQLADAVRRTACDDLACSPAIAGALARRVKTPADGTQDPGEPEARLTRRELEIAALVDQGLSNKEIARRLCIEVPTVKNHVHHILEKMGVHRRGEAAARIRGANRRLAQDLRLRASRPPERR
jgi:two-component system nitrate/nitrite response regulator NarL